MLVTIKKKTLNKLSRLPAGIQDKFELLVRDLETAGPVQTSWQNYSRLGKDEHHCHLSYRYVACWKETRKGLEITVNYVGTREKAPYA